MATLESITAHLLNRAQEAVLQLELWISDEHNLQPSESKRDNEELKDTYSIYVAQLNSLCVRSEYAMKKIDTKHRQRSSNYTNHKYIKDLVYEFQDITLKLNDLAIAHDKNTTPSSKSSDCSWGSFQPRPLKITERHRSYMEAAQLSPIKKENKRKVVIVSEKRDCKHNSTKCVSLPGSPIKETPNNTIRLAKSYDTGLNGNKLKHKDKRDLKSLLKDKQRLSISLFEDFDEDTDSMSDQDTVISIGPLREEKAIPLRRYNSHESILSVKKQPSSSSKLFPSFFPGNNFGPLNKSARISSEPVFSKASNPACSRDLLSEYVRNSQEGSRIKQTEGTSFFARWNPFNTKPNMKEKRHGENGLSKVKNITEGESYSSAGCLDKAKGGVSHVSYGPVVDSIIAYDDLQEALNTELII